MATNSVSPKKGKVVDIPTAPTIGTATAGGESATVAYTAATKGGPATTFTALSNPGSITGTGTSPITVSGLTAGTAYTFTVRGGNATGNGEYSSASGSVTPTEITSYESIATVTLSSSQSSISFTSIPSTYKHLQIRGILRGDRANTGEIVGVQYNGDTTTANYVSHRLTADGTTMGAGPQGAGTYSSSWVTHIPGATSSASIYGPVILDILDYATSNKYRVGRSLGGDIGGDKLMFSGSQLWLSTASITSITIVPVFGTNFVQYSQLALYGIKG
jgi:hypothetical protein